MIAAILIAGTYPSRNKQSRGSKRVERIGRKNKGGKEVIIERIYHVEEESWGRKSVARERSEVEETSA